MQTLEDKHYLDLQDYYESMDKRTKEYKDYVKWKENYKFEEVSKEKGLGDIVEDITEATGIKKLVKFIAGEDCGCDKRKEKLNKIFRGSVKPKECLTEEEYEMLTKIYENKDLTRDERRAIGDFVKRTYERVFNVYVNASGCLNCAAPKLLKKLRLVYDTYEQDKQ